MLTQQSVKLPIIYSKRFNIHFLGLEKRHPFDTERYKTIYNYLVKQLHLSKHRFYLPKRATYKDLLTIHTAPYLTSLKQSCKIAQIAELPILNALPGWLLSRVILKPMQYATGGTILGVELAFRYGWCINLAGGYHHAKGSSSGGFCFYADIPIAVHRALKKNPDLSVLIVDLDAHQGNGCADIFKYDTNIHILDIYNAFIYPGEKLVQQYIDFNYPLSPSIRETDYLALVSESLESAIQKCSPDLIIYNAGADILEGDPLGGMHISARGIVCRDEIVFTQALTHHVPLLMVLAGGYTRMSATATAHSIENLLKNVLAIKF